MKPLSHCWNRPGVSCVLIGALMLVTTSGLLAQSLELNVLPAGVVNQPDYDLHGLQRPALSITGFDNQEPGYNPAFGLGLKQILEARFVAQDPLVGPVFDRLITVGRGEQLNPYIVGGDDRAERRHQLNRNTAILQGRALEALATFVLELNGYDPTALHPELRSHGEALGDLREALANPPGGLIYGDWLDDYVKSGRSITNVARALDLYLALENAYLQVLGGALPPFAGLRPDLLLTEDERVAVMTEFGTAILVQETVLTTSAVDLYSVDLLDILPPEVVEELLWKLEHSPIGDRIVEEVEAGNWAMKQRASAGYSSLAMQIATDDPYAPAFAELREKTFRSLTVSHQGDKSRLRHWNWMTYNGQRLWPESTYYLDFALEEVLAFWHAARANDLLDGRDDPFFAPWFTNVLHWHADLVTPDGRIAPMDDGNKLPVRYGGLMRWSEGYGDAELGRKFAWIEETLEGPARRDETLLLELAIPRTTFVQAPVAQVGNAKGPIQVDRSEQQLVARATPLGDETHYLFMNGEHGISIERGEGHEQADQLNLLYYVGDASYLADSGYDSGYTVENSFWNHYYDHNVMTVGAREGGLDPPYLSILEVRKSSEPDEMGQVDRLYLEEAGSVTVLHGEQQLRIDSDRQYKADYIRDVLFIRDTDPYVIDLNSVKQQVAPKECEGNLFRMQYHVNSDEVNATAAYTPRGDGFLRWNEVDGQASRGFDLFPMSVEFEITDTDVHLLADQIKEKQDFVDGIEKKRLVDIEKLVVSREDRCKPFWTVATLMHAVPESTDDESPAFLWSASAESDAQGWVWHRGSESFDVFVARSVSSPQVEVSFNLADAGNGYPDYHMTLPKGLAYGFARVTGTAGDWSVDPGYVVGFESNGSAAKTSRGTAGSDGVAAANMHVPYGLSKTYPNPANPNTTFTLRLHEAEQVTVAVYNVIGQRVALLHNGALAADMPYTFRVDGHGWAGGMYLIRAQGETINEVRSILLVK